MSRTGNIILAVILIFVALAWFWKKEIALGIIWLCAGVAELITALIRYNKEKKSK